MSIHWSYIATVVITLICAVPFLVACFKWGRYAGEQALIRKLFEAKDQELWLAGHYVSVDICQEKEITKTFARQQRDKAAKKT